jgi:hypothetical protein
MEETNYKYVEMLTEKLILKYPEPIIRYRTSDGRFFTDGSEADLHEDIISRERYYDHLMENRNWFMKLFNIKPSMSFYDEISFKAKINRRC